MKVTLDLSGVPPMKNGDRLTIVEMPERRKGGDRRDQCLDVPVRKVIRDRMQGDRRLSVREAPSVPDPKQPGSDTRIDIGTGDSYT